MAREIEDEKSKWGSRLMEDWKELGVNSNSRMVQQGQGSLLVGIQVEGGRKRGKEKKKPIEK